MPPPIPPTLNESQPFGDSVKFWTDKDVLVEAENRTNLLSASFPAATSVCHGRVHDAESRVPSAWWKTVFSDGLYLQTDGDVVEDPAITMEEIRLLERHEAVRSVLQGSVSSNSAGSRVLDLCCGQGRHLLKLAELYPHLDLHGHDQSHYLITLAQTRAKASNLSNRTRFTIGDCRSVPHPDNSFSLVLVMGNSFGYFSSDNANKESLKEIYRVLRPGGCAVIDLVDGAYMRENFSARGWEWANDTMIVCRERELSKDKKRLISREVVISTNQGVIRDQFYAECLYTVDEIHRLVRESGFLIQGQGQHQAVIEEITAAKDMSKRGQDLGMMEQRHFVIIFKPM
ncbi:hypothetical protein BGX28_003300 [Mortierella sp. GBA30]|nr:hypothetical protein BGX28_003300 [Mortierella sp. GBA30]